MGTLNSDIDANKTSSKMAAYVGKYDRTSAENYDEFLKELDVNFMLRKAATASTPVFEVSVDGDEITFKTSTMLKTMELKFKLLLLKKETNSFQFKLPKRKVKNQQKLSVNS